MRISAIVLAILIAARAADAGCPTMPGADAALATHDDATRVAWIQARLARSAHRSRMWVWGWTIGIVGATAIQVAMIPILGDTRSNRIDFGLGAATTIVGIVPLLLLPPRVIDDSDALEALVASAGDPCTTLADAERRLVADAEAQHHTRSWYVHVGNVLLNGGVTLLFGAFHHWTSGAISGIGGALIGEVIIYTSPIDQIDDLASYRRGALAAPGATAWHLVPTLDHDRVGLALARTFD